MKTAALALRSMPRAALALPPVWRRRLVALLAILAVLLAGYWFWFRDSSFARVQDVYVTGLSGPQSRAIRNALENAGLDTSTLDVNTGALKAAVADYPVVRSITAQGQFPHKLMISVDLNLPVAIIKSPSGRKPVAADGLLLPDIPVSGSLPVITTTAVLPEGRITTGPAFDLLRVVSVAPELLRPRIRSVSNRAGVGLVADLVRGPELRFGNAERLLAKWIAATRVLASPAARGATYIDLRLPERPAAGGLSTTSVIPLAPAGTSGPLVPQSSTGQAPAATTTAPTTTTTPTTTATTTAPAPTATTPTSPTTGGATPAAGNSQPGVQTSPQVSTTG